MSTDPSPLDRLSTGVVALDRVLGGGFPLGSINIVMGQPGTGKTVFTQQMVFHNTGSARPILYLTTLAEPLSKLMTYLQGFSFYDELALIEGVVYEDLRAAILEAGPEAVVEHIGEAIREIGPWIIVVDSFKAIHDLAPAPADIRRLTSELAGLLSAYDATVFLLGEYGTSEVAEFPEFAMADGIIEFARSSSTKRDDRFVRVLKLRGSPYAEGAHAFEITGGGLKVFPRLVTTPVPRGFHTAEERVATGVAGLDALLGGGLWRGSTSLVTGQSGSGKTTLALQFGVEGIRAGEPSLFVNFQENPTQLARTLSALGLDAGELQTGGMHFQYASPVELSIDRIVVDIFDLVQRMGIRRVAIDALSDLLAAADRQRFRDYLYALCQELIVRGVTALFTMEVGASEAAVASDETPYASMVDALVDLELRMEPRPHRTLRVVKARGIAHDLRVHEMTIEPGGVRLGAPLESA